MYGDIHIDVSNRSIDLRRSEGFTDMEKIVDGEGFTGIIKANTTLLVICVVVFAIFLSILLCVVIMFGKSRLNKRNFFARRKPEQIEEEIIRGDETKNSSGELSFIQKVLPHIIKFPSKDS